MSQYIGLREGLASPDSAREIIEDFLKNLNHGLRVRTQEIHTDETKKEVANCLFVIHGYIMVFAEWRHKQPGEILEPLLVILNTSPVGPNISLERNLLCCAIDQHFTLCVTNNRGGFTSYPEMPSWCQLNNSLNIARAAVETFLGRTSR